MPTIYTTNYFLKNEKGKYCNEIPDKKVWILWADGRVNGEYEAIETPIGNIPKYEDLKELFRKERNKDYTREEYVEQFSIRIKKYLEKMDRMVAIYSKIRVPEKFRMEMDAQIERLKEAQQVYGDVASPFAFGQ